MSITTITITTTTMEIDIHEQDRNDKRGLVAIEHCGYIDNDDHDDNNN